MKFNAELSKARSSENPENFGMASFIADHAEHFRASYPAILNRIVLNPGIVFIVFLVNAGMGCLTFLQTKNLYSLSIEFIIFLSFVLLALGRFKKTEVYLPAYCTMMPVIWAICGYFRFRISSEHGFHEAKDLVIHCCVIIGLWMGCYSPSSRMRHILGLSTSLIYIMSLHSIDSKALSPEVIIAFSMAIFIGMIINHLISKVVEYKFFTDEGKKQLLLRGGAIEDVFYSVNHGMFRIYEDSKGEIVIGRVRSQETNEIFNLAPDAVDLKFREAVLSKSDIPDFKRDELMTVLFSILNQPMIAYSINSVHLPSNIRVEVNGQSKFLELTWSPSRYRQESVIDTLLVTAIDRTNEREIKFERNIEREKNLLLTELHLARKDVSKAFLKSAYELIADVRNIICDDLDIEKRKSIFRAIHSIKGASKYAGLKRATEHAHAFEQLLSKLMRKVDMPVKKEYILAELKTLEEILDMYRVVMEELSWFECESNAIEVELTDLKNLFEAFPGGLRKLSEMIDVDSSLKRAFDSCYPTLDSIANQILDNAEGIAHSLNKPMPNLVSEGTSIHMRPAAQEALSLALTHLISNSLDHGIEIPEQRSLARKNKVGKLFHKALTGKDATTIIWSDDGQGLDLGKVREKAVMGGIIGIDQKSDADLANLIFEDGLTTKDRASDISGRGVGLAAVAQNLKALGGSISVRLGRKMSNGNFQISFVISIPNKHFLFDYPRSVEVECASHEQRAAKDALIIDDESLSRQIFSKVVKKTLDGCHFSPDTAESGEVGVELVKKTDYRVIFVDIQMPGLDGFDTCRRIIDLCIAHNLPVPVVVGITATTYPEHEGRRLESGMSALLTKSSSSDELRVGLKNLLNSDTFGRVIHS